MIKFIINGCIIANFASYDFFLAIFGNIDFFLVRVKCQTYKLPDLFIYIVAVHGFEHHRSSKASHFRHIVDFWHDSEGCRKVSFPIFPMFCFDQQVIDLVTSNKYEEAKKYCQLKTSRLMNELGTLQYSKHLDKLNELNKRSSDISEEFSKGKERMHTIKTEYYDKKAELQNLQRAKENSLILLQQLEFSNNAYIFLNGLNESSISIQDALRLKDLDKDLNQLPSCNIQKMLKNVINEKKNKIKGYLENFMLEVFESNEVEITINVKEFKSNLMVLKIFEFEDLFRDYMDRLLQHFEDENCFYFDSELIKFNLDDPIEIDLEKFVNLFDSLLDPLVFDANERKKIFKSFACDILIKKIHDSLLRLPDCSLVDFEVHCSGLLQKIDLFDLNLPSKFCIPDIYFEKFKRKNISTLAGTINSENWETVTFKPEFKAKADTEDLTHENSLSLFYPIYPLTISKVTERVLVHLENICKEDISLENKSSYLTDAILLYKELMSHKINEYRDFQQLLAILHNNYNVLSWFACCKILNSECIRSSTLERRIMNCQAGGQYLIQDLLKTQKKILGDSLNQIGSFQNISKEQNFTRNVLERNLYQSLILDLIDFACSAIITMLEKENDISEDDCNSTKILIDKFNLELSRELKELGNI
ncbi:hypothetical protein ROZALSC1DRAFT_20400 [Rozella allomycis CSF55]|uniref:Uncharacterized protein n=1 Tax=Rozella allomycis (strain CSF55) TaxID=988480 RepID=A0A4P9YR95_ROZAC|nr:hypothetical protein ROZALSC1DRAFT_20400 [Rozella allomycis CSF55]